MVSDIRQQWAALPEKQEAHEVSLQLPQTACDSFQTVAQRGNPGGTRWIPGVD